MKRLFLLLGILLPGLVWSQFQGSDGDGFDTKEVAGIRIGGGLVTSVVLYQGGDGDGFTQNSEQVLLNGQAIQLYVGGQGDGFTTLSYNSTLDGFEPAALYLGGNGDGFSSLQQESLLNGQVLLIFDGGVGDGFSQETKDGLLLTGFMTMLYEGGDGDGFSEMTESGLFLQGLMNDLYQGGAGDGFSVQRIDGQSLIGQLFEIYGGGAGDGFATDRLEGFFLVALPVEWISFDAVKQETSVLLLWSTGSEINNDRFEVERSVDGITFQKIDQVAGAGNYDGQLDYEALDEAPLTGLNYYRIKQVDFDGNFSFTDIRSVLFEEEGFTVKLYPNPNRGRVLNMDITGLDRSEAVSMNIYNNSGQLLMSEQVDVNATVDLAWEWPAGTYWVELIAGKQKVTRSLIIVD